jgi:hypothetical protein
MRQFREWTASLDGESSLNYYRSRPNAWCRSAIAKPPAPGQTRIAVVAQTWARIVAQLVRRLIGPNAPCDREGRRCAAQGEGAPLRTHLAYLRRDGVTRDGAAVCSMPTITTSTTATSENAAKAIGITSGSSCRPQTPRSWPATTIYSAQADLGIVAIAGVRLLRLSNHSRHLSRRHPRWLEFRRNSSSSSRSRRAEPRVPLRLKIQHPRRVGVSSTDALDDNAGELFHLTIEIAF